MRKFDGVWKAIRVVACTATSVLGSHDARLDRRQDPSAKKVMSRTLKGPGSEFQLNITASDLYSSAWPSTPDQKQM